MTIIPNTNNKPAYFCEECKIETKYTQKYKHIKRHTTIKTQIPLLINSINCIKEEIHNKQKELEKYYLLINEIKKEILILESSIINKKILNQSN